MLLLFLLNILTIIAVILFIEVSFTTQQADTGRSENGSSEGASDTPAIYLIIIGLVVVFVVLVAIIVGILILIEKKRSTKTKPHRKTHSGNITLFPELNSVLHSNIVVIKI